MFSQTTSPLAKDLVFDHIRQKQPLTLEKMKPRNICHLCLKNYFYIDSQNTLTADYCSVNKQID